MAIQQNQGWLASMGVVAIPKPFAIEELLAAVDTLLRLGREARRSASPNPVADQEL